MEGVLYSTCDVDATVAAIEQLLELDCRNIWVWTSTRSVFEALREEEWEPQVRLAYAEQVQSIGDCLRELYTRNDSRDNLLVIGDVERMPEKLTVHKNYSSKNCGTVLFGDGNVLIDIEKGALTRYEWPAIQSSRGGTADTLFIVSSSASTPVRDKERQQQRRARAIDIAYCSSAILALFFDNFDCNTFHDLLIAHPVGYRFQALIDKRIKFYDSAPTLLGNGAQPQVNDNDENSLAKQGAEEPQTFESELQSMTAEVGGVCKLELNALRLAYGKTFAQLVSAVSDRPDLLTILGVKNTVV